MQWHYSRQGKTFGPVEEEELFRLARQGQLAPDDLVWNPTLGQKWASASSVENLFPSPPPVMPPPVVRVSGPVEDSRPRGLTHNRDLMRMARESLDTRWGIAIGIALLFQVVLSGTAGLIPFVGVIACLIISGPMTLGLNGVFLSLARRAEVNVAQLFLGFNRFGNALGAYLLMSLFILLWSLLLIVPGIIAAYGYSMTFYIMADDPSVDAMDALARSKAMMRGKKWKLFCLSWRFFGWALLCLLTCGIGYLWLAPYMNTTFAHFYEDVRREA